MPPDRKKPHWSASRFMLFEQCASLYKDRYVDGLAQAPSLAMLFGSAVHQALEALHHAHRGGCPPAEGGNGPLRDARAVYQEQFGVMLTRLVADCIVPPASLYVEGLRMLDAVAELELNSDLWSEPERWFALPAGVTGWGLPTIGAVDLWSPPWSRHGATVWDFKTTAGAWGAERAAKERWQPLLYSWAYKRAYDVIPTFRYLVLSRVDGNAKAFDRTWSPPEWRTDLDQLRRSADMTVERIARNDFACSEGHGTCLQCGERYGHHHMCADAARSARVKLVRSREAGEALRTLRA